MNQKATLFAWKNGIAAIGKVGDWHGYEVFEPKYTANEAEDLPAIILANATEVRFANPSETLACLKGLTA